MGNIVTMDGFEPKKIPLDNIYLDPNNPRFEGNKKVAENMIVDPKAQNYAKDQLQNIGSISELTSSIRASGFISVDRLVVKEIDSHKGSYVVLEGNRRTFACKTLMEAFESGGDLELENVIDTLKEIDCLVYVGETDTSKITSKIQGLRHITRTKDWSPYSQAKHIHNLIKNEQMSGAEVAKLIGLTPNKVTQSQRTLHIFEQAIKENKPDYPAISKKTNFSLFNDTVGSSKDWQNYFAYDLAKQKAQNSEKLTAFVQAILPEGDNEPRIAGAAKDIRTLGKALRQGRDDWVDDVIAGDKTIREIEGKIADPSLIGIGPIISKCNETKDALDKITIKHMEKNSKEIEAALSELTARIDAVKKRVKV